MSYWFRRISKTQYPGDTNAARQSRQSAEFVNGLADDPNKPGYKASPIPTYGGTIGPIDRTQYSVQNVNTADLKTRQPYINADKVKNFDRSKLPKDDTAHPLVIKTRDNQLVVDNGNHRVAHMHSIGMKTTPARIVHEIHGHGGQGTRSIP
jgi:hypothetical protein